MIPDGWENIALGDVVNYKKGFAFNSSSYSETGVRLIRISDTTRNSIHNNSPVYVSDTVAQEQKDYALSEGDIILSTVGSRPHLLDSMVGKAVKIPLDASGGLLNQNLVKLVPLNEQITNDYLYEMVKKPRFIYYISTLVRGNANQVSITLKELFQYKLLLPPLPEQKKIAQILSTWDKAIETVEKLIANSQQKKKALMQQLLTGKKRFPGFDGEWKEVRLGDMCSPQQWATISSKDLVQAGYPVYGANGHIGYFTEYNHENETITVTCRGSTCGEVSLIPEKSYITGNSMCLDDISPKYDKKFIYYALCNRAFRDVISGSAQPQIVGSSIRKVRFSAPSINEQQKITSVLSSADQEIETWQQALEHLKQEKKALMQQLLTGKRRVKVD